MLVTWRRRKGRVSLGGMAMPTANSVAVRINDAVKAIVAAATSDGPPADPDALSVATWEAIVTELQTMVKAATVTTTIGTGDAGLQLLPDVLLADTPTKAPATPKTLTGSIA